VESRHCQFGESVDAPLQGSRESSMTITAWKSFGLAGLCICLISGCGAPYSNVPDAELHGRARQLPLEPRYAFYLEVYAGSRPHNGIVAEDIAALGDPAWKYSMDRAISAHSSDFDAKLPVLQAFGRTCSAPQYNDLLAAARRVRMDRKDFRFAVGGIRLACGLATGKTVQDDEEDLSRACRQLEC
jgi:hypothetical protein